jgi:hypothetical protein
VGAATETMVWSMKVIATAKIIAVRTRLFDRVPDALAALWLIIFPLDDAAGTSVRYHRHTIPPRKIGAIASRTIQSNRAEFV